MKHYPVIIIGGGSTGLAAAAMLEQYDVPYLLIEQKDDLKADTRPVLVHKHTLQIYDRLGVAAKAIVGADVYNEMRVLVDGKAVKELAFDEAMDVREPFGFMLAIQKKHNDELLYRHCSRHIGRDIWHADVQEIKDTGEGVEVRVEVEKGRFDTITCDYLLAADGLASRTRTAADPTLIASRPQDLFFSAEMLVPDYVGANQKILYAFSDDGMVALFPLFEKNHFRAIGILPRKYLEDNRVSASILEKYLGKQLGQPVNCLNYHGQLVHGSGAEAVDVCRQGNLFFAGDAAHIDSPVVGQGMNIGIQDVHNLCWKLALVLHGKADAALLDTYAAERSLSRLNSAESQGAEAGENSAFANSTFAEQILPLLTDAADENNGGLRNDFLHILSRLEPTYEMSPLSQGHAGRVRAGQPMPWLELEMHDDEGNLSMTNVGVKSPLKAILLLIAFNLSDDDSKALTALQRHDSLAGYIRVPGTNHNLDYLRKKGFSETFIAVVRPDNYIGYLSPQLNQEELNLYFSHRLGLSLLGELSQPEAEATWLQAWKM